MAEAHLSTFNSKEAGGWISAVLLLLNLVTKQGNLSFMSLFFLPPTLSNTCHIEP